MKRAGTEAGLDEIAYLSQIASYFLRKLTPAEIDRAKSHYKLGTASIDLIREWKNKGFPN